MSYAINPRLHQQVLQLTAAIEADDDLGAEAARLALIYSVAQRIWDTVACVADGISDRGHDRHAVDFVHSMSATFRKFATDLEEIVEPAQD